MAARKKRASSSSKKRTAKQAAQRKTAAAERAAPLPPRRNCGTMSNHMRLLEMYPSFRDRLFKLEEQTAKYRNTGQKITTVPIVTIKVIVHVVYKDPSQNISDAQIGHCSASCTSSQSRQSRAFRSCMSSVYSTRSDAALEKPDGR